MNSAFDQADLLQALVEMERLELIVFDFDGVMTDNRVYVSSSGEEMVCCSRGDGWGVQRLRETGIAMMILSTEENPVVARRAEKLKLDVVHGAADKALVLEMVLSDRNIKAAHVAYLGNDENDAECLKMVGLPVVVADAHPSVAALAKSVLRRKGGDDAVREFADAVLEAVQMGKVVVS